MNFDIRKVPSTGSTNDDALAAASDSAPEGLVIWALSQRSGRGRNGRVWHSPEGNLYCSVLLKPEQSQSHYGHFSFLTALAIHDTITASLPQASVTLKWPNDVLVDEKKISGILLEASPPYLVAGMGINVSLVPANALFPATSLWAEGALNADVESVLKLLLSRLDYWRTIYDLLGFPKVRETWIARAFKGQMRVRLPSTNEDAEIYGYFKDLDPEGNLVVKDEQGVDHSVNTGDVFL